MKKCFVCGLKDSVIDFDNESFKKCFLKLLFRREKNFAHSEVKLSLDLINNFGYHSSCYKKVTVLSKKYNEEYIQFCKQHDLIGTLNIQTIMPDIIPELTPFSMDIKSELDPGEMKEDQEEDMVSLDDEDQPSASDTEQPGEDLIPLNINQVPPSNTQDPLSEVKVEQPEEVTVEETKVKMEEEVQETGPGVQALQMPLHVRLFRAAKENADLIRAQSKEIAKLTASCNHKQKLLNNMVKVLKRRDNTISSLRAERDELATYIAGRGRIVGGTGGRIQIQSANNTIEEKKPNRKLFIVKRVPKSSKTPPKSVRVKQLSQNTSVNAQKTSGIKRTFDIRENSEVGVKHSLNIVERSSLLRDMTRNFTKAFNKMQTTLGCPTVNIQPKSDNHKVSSVGVQRKSANRQKPTITVKPISEIIISSQVGQPKSDNRYLTSVRSQRTSVIRQKPSITIKPISEIIESPSIGPLTDNGQISSVHDQTASENRQKSSLVVQPKSDVRQIGLQRGSEIRQNALVIQIDGMHNTVLQPKLVRLDSKEMG